MRIHKEIAIHRISVLFCVIVGLTQAATVFAQYDPINPFVMPSNLSLNWYGSGDINNDHSLGQGDLSRLDSMLSGLFSDYSDTRLLDRADLNGDQRISIEDRALLEDFLSGKRTCLPAHWNCLSTKNERIDWLEKILRIDNTEEGLGSTEYSGDFYADQLLINFHGFEETVLQLFSSPPIDYQHNGRFNLPLTYAGIFFNRPELKLNRNLNAILIGDNVFDWADWCFVDPQWDQLLFPTGFTEPAGDESFPPLNNYLDGINNITLRDTSAPAIELSINGDAPEISSGYFDLGYTLSDLNLSSAFYYIDNPLIKQVLFRDSLKLDQPNDKLVSVFDTSGTIHLMLKNGSYSLTFEAMDHFFNQVSKTLQIVVNDPAPKISILSPIADSTYTQDFPSFRYLIDESDFSSAWYSLDNGQTKKALQKEGNLVFDLANGPYHLIVFAEDVFENQDSDTVRFEVQLESTTTEFRKDEDLGLLVYPNPVNDFLNIMTHFNSLILNHLSIYDVSNRVLWESNIEQSLIVDNNFKVNFSGYPDGVYFLRCTFESGSTIVKRIIKQ